MSDLYLYHAKAEPVDIDVCFSSFEKQNYNVLRSEAEQAIKQEVSTYMGGIFKLDKSSIIEITTPDYIPKGWKNSIYWLNNEHNKTCVEFFSGSTKDPEFQEYIRLKAKFEKWM